MVTVERTARILDYFNIGFSEGIVNTYTTQGYLNKVKKPYEVFSKYSWAVSIDSLRNFLLSRGVCQKEIDTIL